MFTELISVDGYVGGQITEAYISLSPAKSFHMLTQQILPNMEKWRMTEWLRMKKDAFMCSAEKKKKKTYQPSNRCGQSVHPLNGTRLDPVDHTVRSEKRKKENEGRAVRKWKDSAIHKTERTNKEPT